MEIKPKTGIERIYFGMSMAEARAVWGDPEKISTFIPLEDNSEDRSIDWEYSNGIELSFDSDDDFLLCSITCESRLITLNGLTIIGLTPKELKLRFPEVKLDDEFELAVDEYKLVNLELSFWVQKGKVYSVTIFPEYNELGNEIIWPKKSN